MAMEAAQVAAKLADAVDSVSTHLLGPNGRYINNHLCYGNVRGDEGKSLKIELSGPKRGCWLDWAVEGHAGDLLDLWAIVRNITIREAMNEAIAWLGIPTQTYEERPMKQYHRPQTPDTMCMALTNDRARTYLCSDRGLSLQALREYAICYDKATDEIAFPYITTAGASPVRYKYLAVERENGKKRMRCSKNSMSCLFGWQAIPPICRDVVITEGEIDSLSVPSFGAGLYGLSIPNGCSDCSWIDIDFERLERMDNIYLMFDADVAGQQKLGEIVSRLGAHRCRILDVPKPHKDANDICRAPAGALQISMI